MASRDSLDRSSSEFAGTAAPAPASNGSEQVAIDPRPSQEEHEFTNTPPSQTTQLTQPASTDFTAVYDSVLQSDIGINTLLNRLKQSIASARDFAVFLKKRSALEEEHAQGLKKLCRITFESTRRPDSRQGSYAKNYEDITRIHDRMADNGIQFALWLHQMHEDLQELATEKERGRKQWKQTGLSAEKRVQDSETALDKAKIKYASLAEDYDRARTGDKQSGRFGLKGPKSAAQVEEDLHRKVQAADSDYSSKVQTAQSLRRELVSTSRPQAIQALQQLVNECDSGLTLQMQKFASFNEKLLLSNGLCVSPLKGQSNSQVPQNRSLRDVVYQIDNDADLRNYVTSFASRVTQKPSEIQYERLHSPQHLQQTQPQTTNRQPIQATNPQLAQFQNNQNTSSHNVNPSNPPNYNQGSMPSFNPVVVPPTSGYSGSPNQPGNLPMNLNDPIQNTPPQYLQSAQNSVPALTPAPMPMPTPLPTKVPYAGNQNGQIATDPTPVRPVFGLSLEDLFARDGSAVPMVVYQCLQAVDLFGLEVEGIYRLSGTASHITKLRSTFDHDATVVDFRNPENFFHDVNSVAGLLKQFFRDLPDPLLTKEHYQGFIEAARIDDDITRRDSLHATINSLPDPNYATLRALTLHLHRVQEHSGINRMNAGNLAICFGPTLMGSNTGPNIADAGWQVRVIDTILQNTYQIFDED